jgi:hypothetical protein
VLVLILVPLVQHSQASELSIGTGGGIGPGALGGCGEVQATRSLPSGGQFSFEWALNASWANGSVQIKDGTGGVVYSQSGENGTGAFPTGAGAYKFSMWACAPPNPGIANLVLWGNTTYLRPILSFG